MDQDHDCCSTIFPKDSELRQKLGDGSFETLQKAFNKLCRLGCEPTHLGMDIFGLWLYLPAYFQKAGIQHRECFVPSLDSWQTLLDPNDNKPPFSYGDLDQIARRAQKLVKEIMRLRKTPLVYELVQQGEIAGHDLLGGGPMFSENVKAQFEGLFRLPNLAKRFGPKQHPDYNQHVTGILHNVKEATGDGHFELVAEVLTALRNPYTTEAITGPGLRQLLKREMRKGQSKVECE